MNTKLLLVRVNNFKLHIWIEVWSPVKKTYQILTGFYSELKEVSDEHPENSLRIATASIIPGFDALVLENQGQMPH